MEYIIVGGNLCIQHPRLQITQVIPPPLILNITNLLFLNKTNFALKVSVARRRTSSVSLTSKFYTMVTFEEAVASLRKSGAKSETDVIVKNITIVDCNNWTKVALTLNREVDGAVIDENGNWSFGKTNVVFMSLYSIVGTLKNTDDTIAIASYIAKHPTSLQIILSGAKIELLQQKVKANETYINAFTNEEVEYESDHDSIFNHVVSIVISDKGHRAIEKIEDKLLGL